MSLNCPFTTAVALKSGAGWPIFAFPADMVIGGKQLRDRNSTYSYWSIPDAHRTFQAGGAQPGPLMAVKPAGIISRRINVALVPKETKCLRRNHPAFAAH